MKYETDLIYALLRNQSNVDYMAARAQHAIKQDSDRALMELFGVASMHIKQVLENARWYRFHNMFNVERGYD